MLRHTGTFLTGLLIGLIATGLLWILISEPRGQPVELIPPPTPGPIRVHVSGAVNHPGVYQLPSGSITQSAIEAAGGPLEVAVLSAVNLAAPLEDGVQIYIPSEEKSSPTVPAYLPFTAQSSVEQININTASAPELESLPGIGPSLAQKIVDYREANGPFLNPEDLMEVSGIGPAKLENIQDFISVR